MFCSSFIHAFFKVNEEDKRINKCMVTICFLMVMRLQFFDELRSFFMFSIDDILTLNIPTFLDPKWVINFALFLIKIWDKFFELRGNYLNELFIFGSMKIALFDLRFDIKIGDYFDLFLPSFFRYFLFVENLFSA